MSQSQYDFIREALKEWHSEIDKDEYWEAERVPFGTCMRWSDGLRTVAKDFTTGNLTSIWERLRGIILFKEDQPGSQDFEKWREELLRASDFLKGSGPHGIRKFQRNV